MVFVYGRRITSQLDEQAVVDECETKINSCIAKFMYLGTLLEQFWNRDYLTNLREFHKKGYLALKVKDVIVLSKPRKRRLKDGNCAGVARVVRKAKAQVITKGRKLVISTAVQHFISDGI